MTDADRVAIRLLSAEDAAPFWSLRLRGLRDHPEAFGRSFEEERATPLAEVRTRIVVPPEGFVLGGWRGAELVGVVGVRRFGPAKQRHKAMLWGVYVAPEARGTGLAGRLLREAIARARALPDLALLHLTVGSRSTAARRLYTSLGFAPYGLERHAIKLADGSYIDEELMVLDLVDPQPSPPLSDPGI